MYTSQQATYKALPSSTRSRRVSGNNTGETRPALHQASFSHTGTNTTVSPAVSTNTTTGIGTGIGTAANGVTLQSWARSQYQVTQPLNAPGGPRQTTPMYQAQYFSPHNAPTITPPSIPAAAKSRPQSSGAVKYAVADYFDPYRGAPQGQTLNIEARKPLAQVTRVEPPRVQTPPSPVVRATRHSRPTTPVQPRTMPLAQSSRDSMTGGTATLYSPQRTPESSRLKPRSQADNNPYAHQIPSPPQLFVATEIQPPLVSQRTVVAMASADMLGRAMPLPTKPRVTSVYTTGSAPTAVAVAERVSANLHVEIGRAPVRAGNIAPVAAAAAPTRAPASELAHAAIRDFVDMKATRTLPAVAISTQPLNLPAAPQVQRPIAQLKYPRQKQVVIEPFQSSPPPPFPAAAAPAVADPPMGGSDKSELIDFIERRRARTVVGERPTIALSDSTKLRPTGSSNSGGSGQSADSLDKTIGMERSDSISSKTSDTSERCFKRSTARLADIDVPIKTAEVRAQPRSTKYSSWYNGPAAAATAAVVTQVPEKMFGKPSPLLSSRIVPRARAHTLVALPTTEEVLHSAPTLPELHNKVAEQPVSGLRAVLNPFTRISSSNGISSNGVGGKNAISSNDTTTTSRNPAALSVGVQTERTMVSRGQQTTRDTTIHSDDAVLDLMRQMDSLRMSHANQITEYQEQVLDLELLNQDLQSEVDHLTASLDRDQDAHRKTVEDMRIRLDTTRQRVDREINQVKEMHASKCNELSDQICMLLERCEKYKARLQAMGLTETQLLEMATRDQVSKEGHLGSLVIKRSQPIEQMQIVDQAFFEKQYVETRESSQEADYFKKLMDIEKSMENTTMALGFELKRTQAKYLQQAADFIREQMARLQTENRSESRLSVRSESRHAPTLPCTMLSPAAPVSDDAAATPPAPTPTAIPDAAPTETAKAAFDTAPELPSVPPMSPVMSLARSLALMSAPSTPAAQVFKEPVVTVAELSVVPMSESLIDDLTESLADALPAPRPHFKLRQRANSVIGNMPAHHAATLSSAFTPPPRTFDPARGFESEGRGSGLARMANPPRTRSSTITTDIDDSPARRLRRSPIVGSNFFASSQESMTTLDTSSITSMTGLMDAQLSSSTLFTSPKPSAPSTIGHFSHYKRPSSSSTSFSRPQTPTKSATMHWPPRSERRAAMDTNDMTAEQLLDSLKLPSSNATPRALRPASPFSISSGGGSLGRNSPLPRTNSFTDFARLASMDSMGVTKVESPTSDSTLMGAPLGDMSAAKRSFDPKAEIHINLGLEQGLAQGVSLGRRNRRAIGAAHRRRSRSVGTWDRKML
ncbi:hypothetical protein LPJ66_000313 [Kickxella alabastrina]|uniref:Uncharacterized protein n=1 Tax=Kickxella alabastrina TaxID=61397 RepID=A0ACC1IWC9_9FUNG|nr:hypothetical protein LPJ66_000313 [Kickxella alabastrina]